jgi:alanyl-tRNA synthetase
MQYNRKSDGTLDDLPAKCVDTGMGFERVVAVIQGKTSNYDTDVFMPLIDAVSHMSGVPYTDGENAVAMRVVADHLRALSFAIADGVMPSNDGRGYVLRRLLRRAARFGRTLGLTKPFLCELFPVLEQQMGGFFPELTARQTDIVRALRAEEESFSATLDRGIAHFNDVIADLAASGSATFPGFEAFKLYDTYGFPLDLTVLMASEKGYTIDAPAFERFMAEQRARARAARKDGSGAENDLVAGFVEQGLQSAFTGYASLAGDTGIIAILADGQVVDSLAEGQEAELLLDATPFYAEAGGQVGDTGVITTASGARFDVTNTRKPAQGILLHKGRLVNGTLAQGESVTAAVEVDRRRAIMRHHTATHLLNSALRKVLGTDSIKQAGSYVDPHRLRFDFTWFEALTPQQIDDIERLVTEYILANAPVTTYEIPLKDVPGSGIIAVFDEKYGDTVRVVDTEGISRELCGGTHVSRTGDIGPFRIIAETSIAAGVRRIEAQTGLAACDHTAREHAILAALAQRLSLAPADLPARVDALLEQTQKLEKELKAAAQKSALEKGAALAGRFAPVAGIPVLIESVGELDADPLRALVESLRKPTPDSVILLAAVSGGKVTFILNAGPSAQAKGLHAGRLVGDIAKITGGGGGGKPDKAQAGGKDPAKLPDALAAARERIAQALA